MFNKCDKYFGDSKGCRCVTYTKNKKLPEGYQCGLGVLVIGLEVRPQIVLICVSNVV